MKYQVILLGLATCLAVLPKQAKSEAHLITFDELKTYHEQIVKEKQEQYSNDLVQKAERLKGKKIGQCVIGVRYFLGLNPSQISGAAKNTQTNANTPSVGAIVVTSESKYGHVGVVLEIVDDQIYIFETNYRWTGRASTRWISTKDKRIKGYKVI